MNVSLQTAEGEVVTLNPVTDEELEQEFEEMESQGLLSDGSTELMNSVATTGNGDPKQDQICKWQECGASLKNFDELTSHLWNSHVSPKEEGDTSSEYVCRWDNCSKRGTIQHSKTALLTHVRSHTGEKPFFCLLPECFKSFSRSDAMLKHMKTVHYIESNNLVNAFKSLQDKKIEKMAKLESKNNLSIDSTLNSKKISSIFEKRIRNEGVSLKHESLLESCYAMKRKNLSDKLLDQKILNHYKLRNIEFNPHVMEEIFTRSKQSIDLYSTKRAAIEDKGRMSNFQDLNNIDDLNVEELRNIIQIQNNYLSKQLKLKKLLDTELLKHSNSKKYHWLKKQILVNSIKQQVETDQN